MPRLKKTISTVKRRTDTANKYRRPGAFAWQDPFPEIHGTLPEKMVYAALTQAGIPFYFLNDVSFNIPEMEFFKEYQVDFLIPSINAIIEVQGSYWHSKPEAIESDSFKLAVYETLGYKVLVWWDYEIYTNLPGLLVGNGILLAAPRTTAQQGRSTELTPIKRTKIDTSKGIRTMNSRRRKPYRIFIGTTRRKVRKASSSYVT